MRRTLNFFRRLLAVLEPSKRSPPPLTLHQLAHQKYLPYVRVEKASWLIDEAALRLHILPALGEQLAQDIREPDLMALIEEMRRKGLGKAMEYKIIAIVKRIFNLAMKWELPGIQRNPASGLKTYETEGRERFLADDELATLLQAISNEKDRRVADAVLLTLLTGARRNEVIFARWDQVDWNLRQLRTPAKGGRPRVIRLNDAALRLLHAMPSRGQSDFVFPGPSTGKPTSIYKGWNRIREAAGLRDVRLHDLRHTFASILVNENVSLYVVKELLGHKTLRMAQRYSHLNDKTLSNAAKLVDAAVQAALEKNKLTPST
jgi:integrase